MADEDDSLAAGIPADLVRQRREQSQRAREVLLDVWEAMLDAREALLREREVLLDAWAIMLDAREVLLRERQTLLDVREITLAAWGRLLVRRRRAGHPPCYGDLRRGRYRGTGGRVGGVVVCRRRQR